MRRRESRSLPTWTTLLMAAALLVLSTGVRAAGEDSLGSQAEAGEKLFHAKCASCHSLGGGDRPTGPDLAGVTGRREQDWLIRFITDPGPMLKDDPVAREMLAQYGMPMPDLGVTREEAEAILTYLAHPGEAQHHPAREEAAPADAGDLERGEALYVGTADFQKGGAPCLGCHGIAGAGLGRAAGASYGPDLTPMWENYGAEGVASILETLPFPSMEPIYADRPLTGQEQRDLAAFLATAEGQTPPKVTGDFALQAGGVFLALFGIFYIFGSGRLKGVRRPLVEKNRKR